MSYFPYQAVLVSVPESEYAADNMTVGNIYTVYEWAGSCLVCSTNIPNDRTMIDFSRLDPCGPEDPSQRRKIEE